MFSGGPCGPMASVSSAWKPVICQCVVLGSICLRAVDCVESLEVNASVHAVKVCIVTLWICGTELCKALTKSYANLQY